MPYVNDKLFKMYFKTSYNGDKWIFWIFLWLTKDKNESIKIVYDLCTLVQLLECTNVKNYN